MRYVCVAEGESFKFRVVKASCIREAWEQLEAHHPEFVDECDRVYSDTCIQLMNSSIEADKFKGKIWGLYEQTSK